MLVDHNGEAADFIRRYVPTDLYLPWRRASWPGFGTAGLAYPTARYDEPEFVLNRLHWPCRLIQQWGYIHLLCGSDGVGTLLPNVCQNGPYFALPLTMGNPGGEAITVPMFLLPPTPLSGIRGLTGVTQSLYLLTLVDVRYFLNWVNTGNLTSYMTKTTTWDGLYKFLINQVGQQGVTLTAFNYDAIPAAYLQPSVQMWNLPYEPIAPVLDAVAFNVGQRITSNWDGSFYAQTYYSAYANYQQDVTNNQGRAVLSGGFRYSNPL